MTKDELYQLRHLKHEIRILEKQHKNIQSELSIPTSDSVSASSASYPYVKHSVTIHGISATAVKKCARIEHSILLRKEKCITEYERLNNFIETVPDSEMRQILTLYYMDCLTWQQVAYEIGETDESYPRRKCDQFLKAAENAENKVLI